MDINTFLMITVLLVFGASLLSLLVDSVSDAIAKIVFAYKAASAIDALATAIVAARFTEDDEDDSDSQGIKVDDETGGC